MCGSGVVSLKKWVSRELNEGMSDLYSREGIRHVRILVPTDTGERNVGRVPSCVPAGGDQIATRLAIQIVENRCGVRKCAGEGSTDKQEAQREDHVDGRRWGNECIESSESRRALKCFGDKRVVRQPQQKHPSDTVKECIGSEGCVFGDKEVTLRASEDREEAGSPSSSPSAIFIRPPLKVRRNLK